MDINDMNDMKVLSNAINKYGAQQQLNVAIEELSELTKEICKHKRGANNRAAIVEEFADVTIMMWQMRMIFLIDDGELDEAIKSKLERLKGRLEDETR